jgi:Tfp pilus assembly protein FimT
MILRQQHHKPDRGFTLYELVIVLCLISLTGFILYPGFKEVLVREQGKQFLEKFSLDMHEASMEAVARRCRVDVKLDKSKGWYGIYPWLKSSIATGQTPGGFNLDHNFSSGGFYFNTSGHISRAGSIYLFYPDGQIKRIILYMDGGVLVIQDG